MAVNLSPIWGAGAQLLDNSGNVLTGGKIYTYLAGTTTPATTYTSSSGNTANSNPIILNSAGRVPYEIWLTDSIEYKFVLKDSNDTLIGTWDNLVGINSNFINYYGQQEIQTATAGQTVFTLTEFEYEPGTGNLSVFVDGVNQYGPGAQYAYVETDASTVTFVSGLHVGASVKFTTTKLENPNVADASQISYTYPDTDAVTQNVEERLAQYVSVKDFGAVGDGVTDDTVAIQNAITAANNADTFLQFDGATYLISAPLTMPNVGISGKAVITGDIVKWVEIKHIQINGELVCDELLLDSVWFASFEKITCLGDITLQSSDPTWGTFWNNFGNIFCAGTLIIDVDQGQSVNQNIFGNVVAQGGVHIKGVATTGTREAYNNTFQTLDTTNANLTATDGTTGWHVLNDSDLNQTNTIMNWDAEVSGTRGIKGNWNVLGSAVDANNSVLSISERNHYLFSGTTIDRNNGDFFAGSVNNLAVGGEWDIIDSTMRRPYCLNVVGTTAATTAYGTSDCPSQIPYEYARETSSANSGFVVNFSFNSAQTVALSMWYQGNDFASIYSDGGSYTAGLVYEHSSGWKLLRVVVSQVTTSITFLLNTSSTAYKKCSINSIFATNGKTCLLPVKQDTKQIVRGTLSLTGGSSVNISLPTDGYVSYIAGLCKISAVAAPVTPFFTGIVGAIDVEFSKTRFNSIDNSTVLGNINKAIGQLNTSGKDITVTGNTTGINLALSSGVDPCTINYEIELYSYAIN